MLSFVRGPVFFWDTVYVTATVVWYSTLFPIQQARMPANVSVVYEAFITVTHTTHTISQVTVNNNLYYNNTYVCMVHAIKAYLIIINIQIIINIKITLLVGHQEGHPVCKIYRSNSQGILVQLWVNQLAQHQQITWGGFITKHFFSPATMSGFFSCIINKTRCSRLQYTLFCNQSRFILVLKTAHRWSMVSSKKLNCTISWRSYCHRI